jgi:excinuclease UvrABC nuclease subunit
VFIWKSWKGESGKRYMFRIALSHRGLPEETPGIYVMVRRRFVFFMKPLYIGKAVDLRGRLMNHERWPDAWRRGATERHVMGVDTEDDRVFIEEDLIRRYKPKLNTQLKPGEDDDGPIHKRRKRGWFG